LLPNEDPNLLLLRPLTGATDEVVAVHKDLTDLLGYSFPEERVRSAKFPPPTPDSSSPIRLGFLSENPMPSGLLCV
jgi:hypothetical protein